MAALLDAETVAYPRLRRGEIVEGIVVGTDRDTILVDIGAKSEGVVPPQEMHCLRPEGPSRLKSGDRVLVFVVQPESPEGQIILSLDRAQGERGWRVLQDYLEQGQSFGGYVTGSNKGGLLVNVEGVNAFVPLSQIASGRPERGSPEATERALGEWVGKTLTFKVIELNRRRNRAILSERAAQQERRSAEKERLLQELREGDVRKGRITSIRDFGIFVDIGGADGLVHLSEISWERTPQLPGELFHVGDEVEVYVLKVDHESKKIALSLRRAKPEQWEEIVSRYREGQIVPGQVTKLAPFGAFVRLEGPIEGLIHISELVDRRVNHPKEVVSEEDVVPVKIVRIEHDRHRLGLSLRQARDKAEEEGWVFHDSGGVVSAPEEALALFGVERPAAAEAAVAEPAEAGAAEASVEEEAPEELAEIKAEESIEEVAEEGASPETSETTEESPEEASVADEAVAAAEVADEPPEAIAEVSEEAVATEPEVVEEEASEEQGEIAAEESIEPAAAEAEVVEEEASPETSETTEEPPEEAFVADTELAEAEVADESPEAIAEAPEEAVEAEVVAEETSKERGEIAIEESIQEVAEEEASPETSEASEESPEETSDADAEVVEAEVADESPEAIAEVSEEASAVKMEVEEESDVTEEESDALNKVRLETTAPEAEDEATETDEGQEESD